MVELSPESLTELAKKHDYATWIFYISGAHLPYGLYHNPFTKEWSELVNAGFRGSAWENPSCDPLKDEWRFEKAYRERHKLLAWEDHGKSLAQIAEELYGTEWAECYKRNMESYWSVDQWMWRKYWELREESPARAEYRELIAEYLAGRATKMTEANRRGVIQRLVDARAKVRAAGQSTAPDKPKRKKRKKAHA